MITSPLISILIPSRKRAHLLKDFLLSVQEKTSNLEYVEVLICIDNDDDVGGYKDILSNFSNIKNRLFIRERSWNLNQDYYSYMALKAFGDLIWTLNDDCLILTNNWDSVLSESYKRFGKKLVYFNIGVSGHSISSFSPFPIVSAEFVKTLGFLNPKEVPTHGSDIILFETFCTLKELGFDRIIFLGEFITVKHINWAGDIGDETQSNLKDNHMRFYNWDSGCYRHEGCNHRDAQLLINAIREREI